MLFVRSVLYSCILTDYAGREAQPGRVVDKKRSLLPSAPSLKAVVIGFGLYRVLRLSFDTQT